jgi:hypothetical protein
VPQNTIAIVYDYDQTLSPSYMQDEVIFPAFGINGESFWRRCSDLVREKGYDNELAYMKVLLDTLSMDRPTNVDLKRLGKNLNFYKKDCRKCSKSFKRDCSRLSMCPME